eukprot:2079891-Lingulodinium_polyedra.AAC.1
MQRGGRPRWACANRPQPPAPATWQSWPSIARLPRPCATSPRPLCHWGPKPGPSPKTSAERSAPAPPIPSGPTRAFTQPCAP